MRERLTTILITSAVLVLMLGIGAQFNSPARAAGGPAASGQYIMVTGFSKSGVETLYVINTARGRLVAYEMQQGGLSMVSVRKIDNDFRMVVYRDASRKQAQVRYLIEHYKRAENKLAKSN